MQPLRVHITGGSGSGVTTLGRALASKLGIPCHDTDDFYWLPTDPPYRAKRDPQERLSMMAELFLPRKAWVLSGSLMGWGDPIIPHFDLAILLELDPDIRMARLRAREAVRLAGTDLLGGRPHLAFMEWAQGYDDPSFPGRSHTRHLAWLDRLPCPSLRLDSAAPVDALLDECRTLWPVPAPAHALESAPG